MVMEKFKFKFTKSYIAFISICYVLLFAAIILMLLRISGAFNLISYSLAGDILTMVFALIFVAIITWVVIDRYYRVKNGNLTLSLAFYVVCIPISEIQLVQEDKKSGTIAVYYNSTKKDTPVIRVMPINIDRSENEKFVKVLREVNPKIIYKTIDITKKPEDTEN